MSELTSDQAGPRPSGRAADAARANARRRRRTDLRLRIYGLSAIAVAVAMLAILLGSLVWTGSRAFVQTHVSYSVYVDPAEVDPNALERGEYDDLAEDAFLGLLSGVEDRGDRRAAMEMLSRGAGNVLKSRVLENPDLIGQEVEIRVPTADRVDQFHKGVITRDLDESDRKITTQQIEWYDALAQEDRVSAPFNWALFTNSDSRHPELAGLKGAIVGSFYALLVCFLISFPLGIGAAVYLEEFAPKNRWTDFVEVNINNLAAVPSVVFGLLGLAVFLNFFGLPRSAPLVGGMTLSLMTLPTIIISARSALKAVPPSVREGALAVGASRQQAVWHHVLPLSISGILTGTIIGLAQALGETAPLLLIGMNAFITSAPGGLMESATALPTQIFMWADSPERGFVARTSAAIVVLIGFLIVMNLSAVLIRNRLERRW